jgi:putative thioredoxin
MVAHVIDVTDATFERDVLERSKTVPVVVDLWAPWCMPCRQLGPMIEAAVARTEGRVELAKVNVDDNPRIAATFRVQSIPVVYALRDREVVDSFLGAVGQATIDEFVDRLDEPPEEPLSEADQLVANGDEESIKAALELEPDHPGATVALAELLIARGEPAEALALLGRVAETPEVRRAAASARLAITAAERGEAADGHMPLEQRVDALLERVKADDGARQELVDLLETMDETDPRRLRYRRALASRLY